MLQIHAPYPDVEAIIFLPSPEMQDTVAAQSRINVMTDMEGGLHTHKTQKQLANRRYAFSFQLTRMKSFELREFIRIYSGRKLKIVWPGILDKVVYLLVNPLDYNVSNRSVIADSDEKVLIDLEFESVLS